MKRHIVLVGMMGAGKTAVGSALSRRLSVPFVDSDAEIETASAMSIKEIFDRDGETFFRARETEVLARLLNGPASIISTGGGAWIQPANRDLIKGRALSVWLDCDLETLWQRVKQRKTRPLLQTPNPKETLATLMAQRNPVYAQADLNFRSRAVDSVDAAATRLITQIRKMHPELLEKT